MTPGFRLATNKIIIRRANSPSSWSEFVFKLRNIFDRFSIAWLRKKKGATDQPRSERFENCRIPLTGLSLNAFLYTTSMSNVWTVLFYASGKLFLYWLTVISARTTP